MSLFPKIKVNEVVTAAFSSAVPRQSSALHPPAWRELNPRPSTPVRPAVAKAERLMAALPEAPLYERYTVSHREDLDAVASRHPGVSPAEIAAANQLKHFRLEAGQPLVIPGPALRTQPKFQEAVRYYQAEHDKYSQLYGAPDTTLTRARPEDIGVKVSQANYQNVITDQGVGLKSTQIHINENSARLQKGLETQLNQELTDKAEVEGADTNHAELSVLAGKRRPQKTQPSNNIATLRAQPNLGNTADGRLVPTRIELDANKAKVQRWAAYEYEKTAHRLGATDKGLWGNLWEATTHRYGASLSATQEAFGEITGNVVLQREAAAVRMNADHRSSQASQRAREQGAVDDYRQIQTSADLGKYMGGLALGTLPYMGEIALGAMTGGTSMGLRASATALQVTRARMAAGFAAGYPSGVGGLTLAQHEQGAGHNAWAAFGLGVPFSAANLLGVEGMAARLSLARNAIARFDGISGAKGAATRAAATAGVMAVSETGTEIGQTFIERYGQLQADISQTFFNQDFMHELPNVMVGGALMGGTLGGGLGGWRRKAGAAPVVEEKVVQREEVNARVDGEEAAGTAAHETARSTENTEATYSLLPVGGPVVNFKLRTYLQQPIAMPTDSDGTGRGVNIHPSPSNEVAASPTKRHQEKLFKALENVDPKRLMEAADVVSGQMTEVAFRKKYSVNRSRVIARLQTLVRHWADLPAKPLVVAIPSLLQQLVTPLLRADETPAAFFSRLHESPDRWALEAGLIQLTPPAALQRLKTYQLELIRLHGAHDFSAAAILENQRETYLQILLDHPFNGSTDPFNGSPYWSMDTDRRYLSGLGMVLRRELNPDARTWNTLGLSYKGGLSQLLQDVEDILRARGTTR